MIDYAFGIGVLWGTIGPVVRTLTSMATGY